MRAPLGFRRFSGRVARFFIGDLSVISERDVSREFEKTLIMVTHDSNVARAADRIMRIEDGVIKESLEPLRLAETVKPPSYIEQIRARLSSIDTQLRELDMEFRTGRIDGDEYVKRRLRLKSLRSSLEDELQRMGTL